MTAVEDLAPYPETEEQATAEALARYMAVAAWRLAARARQMNRESRGLPPGDPRRAEAIEAYIPAVDAFSVVYLLRAMSEYTGETWPDMLAAEMWGIWEEGGTSNELLHTWLTGYGIDPDTIAPQDT